MFSRLRNVNVVQVERSKLQSQQAEVEKLMSAAGSRNNLSTIERAIRTKAGKQFISYADAKHHMANDNSEHSAQVGNRTQS
jgi:hypothetical protein